MLKTRPTHINVPHSAPTLFRGWYFKAVSVQSHSLSPSLMPVSPLVCGQHINGNIKGYKAQQNDTFTTSTRHFIVHRLILQQHAHAYTHTQAFAFHSLSLAHTPCVTHCAVLWKGIENEEDSRSNCLSFSHQGKLQKQYPLVPVTGYWSRLCKLSYKRSNFIPDRGLVNCHLRSNAEWL